jgi:hypothetical protein
MAQKQIETFILLCRVSKKQHVHVYACTIALCMHARVWTKTKPSKRFVSRAWKFHMSLLSVLHASRKTFFIWLEKNQFLGARGNKALSNSWQTNTKHSLVCRHDRTYHDIWIVWCVQGKLTLIGSAEFLLFLSVQESNKRGHACDSAC